MDKQTLEFILGIEIWDSVDVPEGTTIGEYLRLLLETLWREEDCFSGKRPFGNSGWNYDIYRALAREDQIESTAYDEGDGFIEYEYDTESADKLIADVIKHIRLVG